jgi:hypothetical protein
MSSIDALLLAFGGPLIVWGIFLAIAMGCVYGRQRVKETCAAVGSCLVVFFCLISPTVLLEAVLLLVTGTACAALGCRPKITAAACIAVSLGAFATIVITRHDDVQELVELQREYPLVSVADRLQYETARATESSNAKRAAVSAVELAPEVSRRLADFENEPRGSSRHFSLRELHDGAEAQFRAAAGFGPSRMMRVGRWRLELPESPPIRIPEPPQSEYEPDPDGAAPPPLAGLNGETIYPDPVDLTSIHDESQHTFLNPERMGYVRDRDHVAGFEPHQFAAMPQLRNAPQNAEWQVTRLELVSLLRFDEPKVYVSRELPRMDELADAPTRPVNAFEGGALVRLRSEEDLVVDESVNRIRMVGSLRAGKDCLECHHANRGDLLGAFSYDLHRVAPLGDERQDRKAEVRNAL